jgi:hypothetical protein
MDTKMKELLDRIIEANYKADAFFYKKPVKATPNAPASVEDLRRLDAFLAARGLEGPASYKSCLAVYNGIEGFLSPDYALLSVDGVIAKTKQFSARFDQEYPDLVRFVFATDDMSFMAFDVTTSSAGDGYEVGEVTLEGRGPRYDSFTHFLTKFLANLEQTVREQQKDRKKLKP